MKHDIFERAFIFFLIACVAISVALVADIVVDKIRHRPQPTELSKTWE